MSESIKISRRAFISSVLGAIGGSIAVSSEIFGDESVLPIAGQLGCLDECEDIIAKFDRASTGDLMTSYSVFFPYFLAQCPCPPKFMENAVNNIKRSSPYPYFTTEDPTQQTFYDYKSSINPHRIDVLPAVVSCHSLKTATSRDQHEYFINLIAKSLDDPRREILEITLQNLISSALPIHDCIINYQVGEEILRKGDRILKNCAETPKLLSVLFLYTQYILTGQLFLKKQDRTQSNAYKKIGKQIDYIKELKRPGHYWYAKKLIDIYNTLPTIRENNILSLPPQLLESLMGWKKLNAKYHDLLTLFALISARTTFSEWETSIGKDTSFLNVSSNNASKVAFKKGIAFQCSYNLQPFYSPFVLKEDSIPDSYFLNFIIKDYPYILRNKEAYESFIEDPATVEYLSNHVPFSQYNEYIVPTTTWKINSKDGFSKFMKNFMMIATGAITGSSFTLLLSSLVELVLDHSTKKRNLSKTDETKFKEEISSRTKEIQNKISETQNEIESAHGKINIKIED
jgi:hypothetical protein